LGKTDPAPPVSVRRPSDGLPDVPHRAAPPSMWIGSPDEKQNGFNLLTMKGSSARQTPARKKGSGLENRSVSRVIRPLGGPQAAAARA